MNETLFYSKLTIKILTVLYTCFDQPLDEVVLSNYLKLLPEQMVLSIRKYRRWQDQHAALFGKLLLLNGLQQYGIMPEALHDIQITEYGKPYLNNGIKFNISHSGKYVLCAITQHNEIGIDIEQVDPRIRIKDFRMVFSDNEWVQIINSKNQIDTFYSYWALKESVIKTDGRGLSAPVKDTIINSETVTLNKNSFYYKEIILSEKYKSYISSTFPIKECIIKKHDF